MIDHTGIGVADVAASAKFYDALLGALGMRRVVELPGNDGVGYGVTHPVFWIDRFHPHGVWTLLVAGMPDLSGFDPLEEKPVPYPLVKKLGETEAQRWGAAGKRRNGKPQSSQPKK